MPDLNSQIAPASESKKKETSGPVVLLLLDSWGVAPLSEGNAFNGLNLKNLNRFLENYPVAVLSASGEPGQRYQILGAGGQLTKIISEAGLKQRRLSESEAAPFLEGYFINGRAELLAGESREVISSPGGDRQENLEEASAALVKKLISLIKKGEEDFIVLSLSYLDLVAQTGDWEKTRSALKTYDLWVGKIGDAVSKYYGTLILSSAYGRVESLRNSFSGVAQTDITNKPIPFLIVGQNYAGQSLGADVFSEDLSLLPLAGDLSMVAPTILNILKIKIPKSFPGKSLL
ncbi:MAG: hypothetical protein ACOX6C_02520 [Patescibacteria group bacterium]|jgi:2,3-bisphosphoglycerate-independent phosphoglycerate mutase